MMNRQTRERMASVIRSCINEEIAAFDFDYAPA